MAANREIAEILVECTDGEPDIFKAKMVGSTDTAVFAILDRDGVWHRVTVEDDAGGA